MITSPFLKNIKRKDIDYLSPTLYPYNVPIFKKKNLNIEIKKPILIISGDNGTGKSTLLESIACNCGFNINGGNKNHLYEGQVNDVDGIIDYLVFSWKIKINDGFFMRADSFAHFANYIDQQSNDYGSSAFSYYGGKSLNEQSHGESFLSLFQNRFTNQGIYILDEPEAALSPQRILSFMVIMKELADSGNAQFIISTHSPILMAMPDAQFLYISEDKINEMNYKDTEHYQVTKSFLDNPERMLKYLFENEE